MTKFVKRALCLPLLALLLTTASALAAEEVLVVSDIDDTLKISHVLDGWERIGNALDYESVFAGMPELMREVERSEPNARFVYLSNAPRELMEKVHELFLSENRFPAGELILRSILSSRETFKLKPLVALIEKYRPKRVLLLGDNGEVDPAIYAAVAERFPSVQFTVVVRQLYSAENARRRGQVLRPGQIGFVTALDAALQLQSRGWLDATGVDQVFVGLPSFLRDPADPKRTYLPEWADCRDFSTPLIGGETRVRQLAEALADRCDAAARR